MTGLSEWLIDSNRQPQQRLYRNRSRPRTIIHLDLRIDLLQVLVYGRQPAAATRTVTNCYQKALERTGNRTEATTTTPMHLEPFVGGEHQDKPAGLNFSLLDYLVLTDWAGRAISTDKAGAIPSELAPILERLNIDPEAWLDSVKLWQELQHRHWNKSRDKALQPGHR